jgi:serine/threonine-protein kinase
MDDPIPFGRYLLGDRIAVGGMAEVFAAVRRDGAPRRLLALKRILPTLTEDRQLVGMFLDEARIAAQLRHPGIAAIHDLGRHGDAYFIAMDYVQGVTLRALLDRFRAAGGRLPVAVSALVAHDVAEALDYAHRERDARGRPLRLVHRDVSPVNVLLGFDGAVRLIDFGIAQAAISSRGPDAVLRGKFGYMSPEQVRGLPVDRRADVFSLGAVLHEMLTGDRLFTGPSELAVLGKVRSAEVAPPSGRNPEVSPDLDAVVLRALAREPEDRFSWAGDLRDALRPWLPPGPGRPRPDPLVRLLGAHFGEEIRLESSRAARLGL